jgi:predicted SAM-dependent methyltransferase
MSSFSRKKLYGGEMQKLNYLNLGCGTRFNKLWVNIDMYSTDPEVMAYNLLNGLPFKNNTFAVVYHSHVLEHFSRIDAELFIAECFRVLQPGGIIRIAVPNLEQIVVQYLTCLNESVKGEYEADDNYDWMMLELYDQTVRKQTGGEMAKMLKRETLSNKAFIHSRIGQEAEQYWEKKKVEKKSLWQRMRSKKLAWFLRKGRLFLAGNIIYIIAGKQAAKAFKDGLFQNSGELHQWMYDRYSLTRLLKKVGFIEVTVQTAFNSIIPQWNTYMLDSKNGIVFKPDSLFIEAKKAQ